ASRARAARPCSQPPTRGSRCSRRQRHRSRRLASMAGPSHHAPPDEADAPVAGRLFGDEVEAQPREPGPGRGRVGEARFEPGKVGHGGSCLPPRGAGATSSRPPAWPPAHAAQGRAPPTPLYAPPAPPARAFSKPDAPARGAGAPRAGASGFARINSCRPSPVPPHAYPSLPRPPLELEEGEAEP